ncbi:MAG TPA: hypothetical protein VKV16_02320 [Solirubrobacteraceae bacterium]|nr:hypothetical protein [Solirubrobacteraceae bacterium]
MSPAEPPRIERASIEDLVAVLSTQREFWGGRDVSGLHHVLLVHEFGDDTAFAIRDGEARVFTRAL